MKNKKLLIPVVILVVALIGWGGFYVLAGSGAAGENTGKDPKDQTDVTVVSQKTGYPASEKDMRIYSVVDQYMKAQVENDRNAVRLLLSEEHKQEWTDDSFLMTDGAYELFNEVKLANLKMGVIDFTRLDGKEVGAVLLNYSVQLVKGGEVEVEVEIVEELALANYQETWLVDRSLRRILAQK